MIYPAAAARPTGRRFSIASMLCAVRVRPRELVTSLSRDCIFLLAMVIAVSPAVSAHAAAAATQSGNAGPPVQLISPARMDRVGPQVQPNAFASIRDEAGSALSIHANRMLVASEGSDDGGLQDSGEVIVYARSEAGDWVFEARLLPDDPVNDHLFGRSVSINGNRAAVGAPADDEGGESAGAVYVYERQADQWSQIAKLVASDSSSGDFFGSSVAVFEDYVLVGAHNRDGVGSNQGALYVFRFNGNGWDEIQILVPSDVEIGDAFGWSVAASSERVLISSPLGGIGGKVYEFLWDGILLVENASFVSANADSGDFFGGSVALSANRALIGAPGRDDPRTNAGGAYIFEHAGMQWIETALLEVPDPDTNDRFGSSVAIEGDLAIIGALGSFNTGTVHVFEPVGSAWTQTATLRAPEPQRQDDFGLAVEVVDGEVFVGSPGEGLYETLRVGVVWRFMREEAGWLAPTAISTAPNGAGFEYGYSLDMTDDWIAVGSPGNRSGSVDMFRRSGTSWAFHQRLVQSSECGFGHSVSMEGDRLLVAMPYGCFIDGSVTGEVHSFLNMNGTWTAEQILRAEPPDRGGFFGQDVGLSGQRAIVGSHLFSNANDGRSYIFDIVDGAWSQSAIVVPLSNQFNQRFGRIVAIEGDVAVGSNLVGTFVFEFNGTSWNEVQQLEVSSSPTVADSLDIDDGLIVVGSRQFESNGAVFLFEKQMGSWQHVDTLIAPDGMASDYFGDAVALSGNSIVVGSSLRDDLGASSGAAYLFRKVDDAWQLQGKLLSPEGLAGDLFGSAVAASRDRFAVGAYRSDAFGTSSGVAFGIDIDRIFNDGFDNSPLMESVPRTRE